MCSGTILATVNVLGEALSINAQNSQASAQANALGRFAALNTAASYSALSDRQHEESVRDAHAITQRIRQGMRERASITALQAESGVTGASLSRDIIASKIWEAEDIGTIRASGGFAQAQLQREKLGAKATGESQVARARSIGETRVNPLATGLRLIGAGLSGFSTGERLEVPTRARRRK